MLKAINSNLVTAEEFYRYKGKGIKRDNNFPFENTFHEGCSGYLAFFDIRYPAEYSVSYAGYPAGWISGNNRFQQK